jgi:outer membrane putative beta-barrel porin/alpha-amylase
MAKKRRIGSIQRRLGIALLTVFGWTGAAWAAPETFNTALPVARGDFVYRQQFLFLRSTDDPTSANREVEALGGVSVLGYGVTPDLTLFGILPYLDKRIDLTAGGERIGRSARGIGDFSLIGRYTAYQDNFRGGNFRIAPFVGLQMPTGESTASDRFGRIPPPIQPGSGAWNPLAGIVATYQTLDYEIDGQASYQANTPGNSFSSGNVARLDGSFQYRLWPRELKGGVPGFLYGVLEVNLIHQEKDRISGAADPNSGGTSLFIDPGVQYVMKQWVLEAIVQLPAIQNLNGTALRNDYTVLAGFRVNF